MSGKTTLETSKEKLNTSQYDRSNPYQNPIYIKGQGNRSVPANDNLW
jgi:hypothetical protein